MAIEEKLGKLAPKVSAINTGGVSTVPGRGPQIEVAHATKGISHAGYALVNVKYGNGDRNDVTTLRERLQDAVKDMARVQGWDCGEAKLLLLAEAAMTEFVLDPVCRRCKGEGVIAVDVQCPRCEGSGRRRWAGWKRARAIQVSWKGWRRRWAHRYACVVALLQGWESAAISMLRRNVETPRSPSVDG